MPALQALARDLGERGLVVLAVNYEESGEAIRAFVHDVALRVPVLLDRDGAVARQYRVTGLPVSFFVDRQGFLVAGVLGVRDWRGAAARAFVAGLLGRAG
jgi:peroxiredoxin